MRTLVRTIGGRGVSLGAGLVWCLVFAVLMSGLGGCEGGGRKARVARAPGSPVDPDELTGRWKLAYAQIPVELDFCLIDIEHNNKKYEVRLLTDKEHPSELKLKTADVKDDGQVRLEIEAGGLSWSYHGRLDGETIWGTLMVPQFQILPAKLERTELKVLDHSKEPPQIASLPDLIGAENAADKYVALNEFVHKQDSYRSPLLFEGYAGMAKYFKAEKLKLADIKELLAEFRKAVDVWGPRLAPRVDLEFGKALAQQEIEPELAKELLSAAEKQFSADTPGDWKVHLADAWVMVGDHERGLKLLKPLQELDPSNPYIQMVYAQAKEKAKDNAEALKVYAGLAMLPLFEQMWATQRGNTSAVVLPSERVARLWKEKNGDTKGLDEFLKKAYEDQMKLYVPQRKITKREADSQVMLAEVFTGSSCNPCVPLDIAAEALRRSFSPQELIVIKYHEHAPLVDPLANDGTMERLSAYAGKGTPMLYVNGFEVPGVGGTVLQASSHIARLRGGIENELKKKAPASIKLSATREGDDIEIKAAVTGIKTTDNDPRLYLVLVENGIEFPAMNGIRVHNGVARAFPGGAAGTKLKPGEVKEHVHKVSIEGVRKELAAHLKQFEDRAGREFPMKPMELKNLQIVAFVQNQITKSYMQAAVVDIPEATAAK